MCTTAGISSSHCGFSAIAGLLFVVPLLASATEARQVTYTPDVVRSMTLEQLMNVDISTASRRPERLLETAAAAYVITRDDIRRSGATTIAHALRLAPGVEVAQASSHSWAISIRGFNGDLSNKLLVLIDGRSVYSPLFAGVFWDAQDYLLEDIERIEVISGPGGTLWGANAVNGVINIITRSALDTDGTLVELGGGNEERTFGSARYATHFGDRAGARAYLKYFDRDSSQRVSDGRSFDDWTMLRGGFRSDWDSEDADSFTLQGDAYDGEEGAEFDRTFTLGTRPTGPQTSNSEVSGANILGRWTRTLGTVSNLTLQMYWDRTAREIPTTYNERRDTFDVDFQHRFEPGGGHDVMWGAAVRRTEDDLHNTVFATFIPDSRTDWTYSSFVQDRIAFADDSVFLTLGSKVEHNDYTGFELQPNVRFAWLATDQQTIWGAVSRAVRIPARLDADIQLTAPLTIPSIPIPIYARINGSNDVKSERLIAYEAGWRMQLRSEVSFDVALFFNDYDDLPTTEPKTPFVETSPAGPYILLPNALENRKEGEAYGGTLMAQWLPMEAWRLQFQYSYLEVDVDPKSGTLDPTISNVEGNSPEQQFALHSFADLPYDLTFFTSIRYVDGLPSLSIDSYTELALSLVWRAGETFEVSVTGRNLLDSQHPEFGGGNAFEIQRSIYAEVVWRL